MACTSCTSFIQVWFRWKLNYCVWTYTDECPDTFRNNFWNKISKIKVILIMSSSRWEATIFMWTHNRQLLPNPNPAVCIRILYKGISGGFAILQRKHSWRFSDARYYVIRCKHLFEPALTKIPLRATTEILTHSVPEWFDSAHDVQRNSNVVWIIGSLYRRIWITRRVEFSFLRLYPSFVCIQTHIRILSWTEILNHLSSGICILMC